MKVIKTIDNNEILTATVLVMCCLGYIWWGWFWICFVMSEFNALVWRAKTDKEAQNV